LHTMISTVRAALRPGTDAGAIVRALFPCGSVTGAPKIRAMEIINELEADPRGVYCGAIGHFSPDGAAHFNVAIRTLTIGGGRGELGIGGAVVHDSTSASEYAECLLKARYFESAHKPIGLIETLRWSPDDGFVRGALHLERMEHSAAALGLSFNRDAAQAAMDNAVRGAGGTQRVRLTLDEAGVFACTTAPLTETQSWRYVVSPLRLSSGDALARHKNNWREIYEGELARLSAETGCDEVLFLNECGELVESARANLFVRIGGVLFTPPLSSGPLPGCLRRELLARGECAERVLTLDDLDRADAVYFGNSLRGLVLALASLSAA
ncbi:MAG TPA: chorismate-binding protein, partial [Rhizomicrobium sp.]|nr:chorismate-binding protein [Rhizomicrobium sp.]